MCLPRSPKLPISRSRVCRYAPDLRRGHPRSGRYRTCGRADTLVTSPPDAAEMRASSCSTCAGTSPVAPEDEPHAEQLARRHAPPTRRPRDRCAELGRAPSTRAASTYPLQACRSDSGASPVRRKSPADDPVERRVLCVKRKYAPKPSSSDFEACVTLRRRLFHPRDARAGFKSRTSSSKTSFFDAK